MLSKESLTSDLLYKRIKKFIPKTICFKVKSDHTGVSIMSNDCPTAAGLLLNMAEDNSLHFFFSGDEFYIGGKKEKVH